MQAIIFVETLRRNWRQTLYWGMGLLIYALYPFVMLPNDSGLEGYGDILEGFDPAVLSAFGLSDGPSIATPEGFVGYAFFSYILLIMGVFAVIAGLNITTIEEDSGTMDVFLSLPIPRWQVIVEKIAAYTVVVIIISLMSFVGLQIGQQIVGDRITLDNGKVLAACLGFVPPTVLMITFTAFVGTMIRRRVVATAIAGGFVVISYLINAIGAIASNNFGDAIRQVSLFNHYNGSETLSDGLALGNVLLIVAVTVLLLTGAVQFFKRRDIAI